MTALVSVCMITYNHEKFIAEAIEGVLMQEVDFEVELVIADDASTDRTGEIIQKYIDNHPKGNWIKYTRHQANKGMMPNFIWALEQCKGEFIAICEGDDYWVDNSKINIQTKFLQMNYNNSSCFHIVKVEDQGVLMNDFITERKVKKLDSSYWDILLYGNFIHTSSFFFRSSALKIPEYFNKLRVGDFFLFLEVSKKGPCRRLDFEGSVYRYNVGSFSSSGYHEMRRRFKMSLYLAYGSESNFLKKVFLLLKFNQDNLVLESKTDRSISSLFDLFSSISILQILKSIYKFLLKIEYRKIYNA